MIQSAFYPAKGPLSLCVFVHRDTQTYTKCSQIHLEYKYTILALLTVDPARQNLNIVMPPICSNVSKNEREKETNGEKFYCFI